MYRSFGITIRPRCGLTDVLQTALSAYLSKLEFASMVVEKSGIEKHCHVQIWCEPKYKGDVKKQFLRLCERHLNDWDSAQKKYCVCIRVCYNCWISDYCIENESKLVSDDNSEIIMNNIPLNESDYYPTEEEQEAAIIKANAHDSRYANMHDLFNQWCDPDEAITLAYVAKFLAWAIYNDGKKLTVPLDKRARTNLCKNLYLYISKSASVEDFLSEKDYDIYIDELDKKYNAHCLLPNRN